MSVGEYCNREVVVTQKNIGIQEAARLMREFHVGDLIVVERIDDKNVPIGIITDRDLVIEILAQDISLDSVTVGDVMQANPATAQEQDGLWDTLKRMRSLGVRRIPVVNVGGSLEGILTLDDVLELLTEELTDLVKLVKHEIGKESHIRR